MRTLFLDCVDSALKEETNENKHIGLLASLFYWWIYPSDEKATQMQKLKTASQPLDSLISSC